MTPFQGQDVDLTVLQTLATSQLPPEKWADGTEDLLTGFHVVAGERRLVVLEGLAEGAMTWIADVAEWAMDDVCPMLDWLFDPPVKCSARRVVFNPHLRWRQRAYAELGLSLWLVKLRAGLEELC